MTIGTASIAFRSGNVVLPAHTLYDRQVLVDHVLRYVRRGEQVRVRVDYVTWTVAQSQEPIVCQGCSRPAERAACRRFGHGATAYCVTCALARPRLTMPLLTRLPADATLCDVQAQCAYGGEMVAWTRWPQATPGEIVADMRLQRRFAPVMTWTCAEIRGADPNIAPVQSPSPRAAKPGRERTPAPAIFIAPPKVPRSA
jgi:hypothetical protein